ncbi:MAG TPA: hypothetical protein DCY52_01790, partial [Methylococcaceae bacterium]|nr:hypothetical protein [Methylococcaceae bacterium]
GLDKDELIGERRQRALTVIDRVSTRWQWIHDHLDLNLATAETSFVDLGIHAGEFNNRTEEPTLFHRLQDHSIKISWKQELRKPFQDIFEGDNFRAVLERIETIHREVLRGR